MNNKTIIFIFFILLATISSCSSLKSNTEKLHSLNDNNIDLNDLQNFDLVSLDKKNYLINLNSYTKEPLSSKKVGLIIIGDNLKQKKININSINLKYWISKELSKKHYALERINEQTPIIILVEYGIFPISNKNYETNFDALLFKKILKIRAINYLMFKTNKQVETFWSGEISLIGPSTDLGQSLGIIGNFISNILENNIANKKIIISNNDPKLNFTKDVPTTIFVDDFKPTVEELEFFN